MTNSGRIAFVCVCSIIGAVACVTGLPAVIESVGKQVYSINREIEGSKGPTVDYSAPPAKTDGLNEPDSNAVPGGGTTEGPGADGTGDAQAGQSQKERSLKPKVTPGDDLREPNFLVHWSALALLGAILGGAIGSALVRVGERVSGQWEKMPAGDKVTSVVGSFAGVIVGIIVSVPFMLMFQGRVEGVLITIGLILGCSASMIYLLRSLAPYMPWETSATRTKRTGLKILDTNILIDGRIYDLMRTGFVDGDIYVPSFVLLELQHIADSNDSLRRQRGRRGLDVLKRIQSEFTVEVGSRDRYAGTEQDEVDSRLVKLAKALGGDLVSNDFNLNRVASIQEVRVLNINDLALALRPNVLPGESLDVTVIKEGNQQGQGVGYLDDGTMVVVEHGTDLIGHSAQVTVTQVIQTERGKMIFADAAPGDESDHGFVPRRKPRYSR